MTLTTLIKRLQNIMRGDKGVDGDAQRLSQIVWLLFLKVFDFKEEEGELNDDYEPVIPVGYRWRDWAVGESVKDQMTGNTLLDFVNNRLFPVLRGEPIKDENGKDIVIFGREDKRSLLIKQMMSDAANYQKDGILLRQVINLFNEVDFTDSTESHQFNNIYEELLRGLQSAGNAGEFYTNRAITSFCIEHIDPRIGMTLADFAAGTGGFLVDGLSYMRKQILPGDIEAERTIQRSISACEWKPLPYMLLVTNLLLHGVQMPDVYYGSALDRRLADYTQRDSRDRISMNPPYGGVASEADKSNFPMDKRSSETFDLFVQLMVKRLSVNGKAVVVLPDGFLFATDNIKEAIKQHLMKECNLHTIIRLPQSCFAPYTSIATNLLFFDKTGPTQETWFYRLDMPEGYKHFSKTKPMQTKHLEPVSEWWRNRVEIKDERKDDSLTETWKARKYAIDEIKAGHYNLDLCGFPHEEQVILSPEDTITRYVEKREALDTEIDQQLTKIKSMLGMGDA